MNNKRNTKTLITLTVIIITVIATAFTSVAIIDYYNTKQEIQRRSEAQVKKINKELNKVVKENSQIMVMMKSHDEEMSYHISSQNKELKKAKKYIGRAQTAVETFEDATNTEVENLHDTAERNIQLGENKINAVKLQNETMAKSNENKIQNLNATYKIVKKDLKSIENSLRHVTIKNREWHQSKKFVQLLKKFASKYYPSKRKNIKDSEIKLVKLQEKVDLVVLEYDEVKEGLVSFEVMLVDLNEKLKKSVSTDNMAKTIGFSEEQLRYLLRNWGQIDDPQILATLPRIMESVVDDYEVNEIASIAVMSLESGYFNSGLAVYSNNYGGLMARSGRAMSFETVSSGLEKAIKVFHSNMKGEYSTLEGINSTYCTTSTWAPKVRAIMYSIAATQIADEDFLDELEEKTQEAREAELEEKIKEEEA